MAETPTDPRWPPDEGADFDSVLNRLLALKAVYFPQHTARDAADPFIQLLMLVAALGTHSLQRVNRALKQLDPRTATSRKALISLLEVANRPLVAATPSRGYVYAKLSASPTTDTVYIEKGSRIIQPGTSDPVFSVDADVSTGSSVAFSMWWSDSSANTVTAVTFGVPVTFDVNDAWIIGFDGLTFDSVTITLGTPHSGAQLYCLEYRNFEWGRPTSITNLGTTLKFVLTDYLHGDTVPVDSIVGLSVTVRHKPSATQEVVSAEVISSKIVAVTSFLGQTSPSTIASDYEVLVDWRPVPNQTDTTSGFTATGNLTFAMTDVRSSTDWWDADDTYGYALRFRNAADTGSVLPEAVTVSSITIATAGAFYATAYMTQGYSATFTIGQTDGTAFQQVPLSSDPLVEPVADPAIVIVVGGDTDWTVVTDMSNTGSSSKHAILREDVDDGWCIVFGDGAGIGVLPDIGSSVKVTYRTGSSQPGDLGDGTSVKPASSSGLVKSWMLPRGTSGYAPPECSTKEDALRFRASVIPQLALRAESVVTPDEIVTAMSGGAPNRATFTTSDGRKPFARALWSLEGAGARQYRVIVVGADTDADGAVSAADLVEAATWLNGETIGVEIVGGHGPQNTEAIVGSFSALQLMPLVTITIANTAGVAAQAEQVLRSVLQPHAKDDDGNWRWEFGGTVPVAVIFGKLWDALPGRTMITVQLSDHATIYNLGDSVSLDSFELPVLADDFDPAVYISVVTP